VSGAGALLVGAARMAPVVALAPPFGRGVAVRAIVGAALVATVWPALIAAPAPSALWCARELLVGLVLGLLVALPFRAAEAAGALVGDAVALAAPGAPQSPRRPLADGWALFALALWAALSGPRLAAAGLAESYAAFPVGSAPVAAVGARLVLDAGARLVLAAAALAAPALAALLFADLAAGLALRAQPALNQVIGAPPVRLAVVVLALTLGATAGAAALAGPDALAGIPRALVDAARALTAK
jgi:flagellar biosynthesis protein FliR